MQSCWEPCAGRGAGARALPALCLQPCFPWRVAGVQQLAAPLESGLRCSTAPFLRCARSHSNPAKGVMSLSVDVFWGIHLSTFFHQFPVCKRERGNLRCRRWQPTAVPCARVCRALLGSPRARLTTDSLHTSPRTGITSALRPRGTEGESHLKFFTGRWSHLSRCARLPLRKKTPQSTYRTAFLPHTDTEGISHSAPLAGCDGERTGGRASRV